MATMIGGKMTNVGSVSARPSVSEGEPSFRSRVKPVSNAIGILRYLSKSKQAATVTQLARQLAINTSTCFNILRTLLFEGLVEFNESSKSYRVGLGVVKLAEGVLTEAERLVSVRPSLHKIVEEHHVTLLLWRRIGVDRMLLVWVENSSADMQIHLRSGQRLPLLIGATGRVAASRLGLTKRELSRKFRSLRWAKRLSFGDYWRDVQAAKGRGWAIDEGFFSAGTTTVAVPIMDRTGIISHSLVAIMFRGQHDPTGIKSIAQDLIQVSTQLTAVLM
jgi:DNA-binding IclR family transcriptional regulator